MGMLIQIGLKRCAKCKQHKPLNHYRRNRARNDGLQTYCNPCRNKRTIQSNAYRWGGSIGKFKKRAARQGLPFKITAPELQALLIAQEGKCALTGIVMVLRGGNKIHPNTCSVDRIYSSRGYVIGNLRLICYAVNAFRGRSSDTEMYDMAKRLLAYRNKIRT